jgi:glutathione S-transferase
MNVKSSLPVLYSFRRCPYAIRARLAIKMSGAAVELREVLLAEKPKEMLASSPKGTIPVLVLQDGSVIDESRDIMLWSLRQSDPENWLQRNTEEINNLIDWNDNEFKQQLDHYKYADRFPEYSCETYRQRGETFLQELEQRLHSHLYLTANTVSMADMAIFPFIRQFAFVDKEWFDQSKYTNLKVWLEQILASDLFSDVMIKYQRWQSNTEGDVF